MIAQITTIGQTRTPRKIFHPIPYFERNNFIREDVTAKEVSSIHELGLVKMTSQDLMETKAALNVIGYDPATKLINLMVDSDLLALARTGLNYHPHLGFLASLLPRLRKEGGATHLALCLPRSLQKLLDVFAITGEIIPSLSPVDLSTYGLVKGNDFMAILQAARLSGYKLAAVEPDNSNIAFDPRHEQQMAEHILTILERQEGAKLIFLAPDRHLSCLPVGDWLPTASVLKEEGIKLITVNQFWHSDFMPKIFDCLLTGLLRPFALASKDTKMFKALQSKALPIEYIVPHNWDLTIIYPRFSGNSHSLKDTVLKISNALSKTFCYRK